MSKAAKLRERKKQPRVEDAVSERPAPVFKPPFKPRRGLFYGLLALFGLWVAGLLVLYFTTIFPHRGERPPHERVEPNSGMTVPR